MKSLYLMFALGLVACGSDGVTAPKLAQRPTPETALALGSRFTCALTTDGKAYCWGDDVSGQLGDSTFTPKNVPTAVAGHHSFVAIAGGEQTVCALDTAGTPWCWGDDPTQPGVRQSFRNAPTAVSTPKAFVSLTVGRKFGCGLDDGGTAYCWGENGRGQLGQSDTLGHATATRVAGNVRFTSLAAGFWSVCGLASDQAVYCWGDNAFGELATGDTVAVLGAPRKVSGTSTFKFLTSGSIHSCGITTAGQTMCWGSNFSGQLGDGSNSRHLVPTETAPGLTFVSLAAERANSIFTHTCGVTTAGDVYCWGWNSKSQLGTSATVDACVNGITQTFVCAHAPVKVTGISGVSRIDAGLEHTCAISGTSVFCWGDDSFGALGDGSGVATSGVPIAVKGGLSFP